MKPDQTARPSRKRSKGRWAWLVALCVALGLITSVGIAWAWASLPPPTPTDWFSRVGPTILVEGDQRVALRFMKEVGFAGSIIDLEGRIVPEFVFCGNGEPRLDAEGYAQVAANAACREAIARHEALLRSPYADRILFSVVLAGWPEPCLAYEDACTKEEYQMFGPLLKYNMRTGEIESPPIASGPRGDLRPTYHAINSFGRPLPLMPLWPGLLSNTSFFGGAWAALIFTPLAVRHWLRARRARRGGCPKCGYSREGLRDGAACPECGHGA